MSTITLRAVPIPETDPAKPRTETEEKLWQALRDHPGSTAAALSVIAGLGKSTAPKILTRWENDGLVARTAGIADGGSRPADRWAIVTTEQPIEEPEPGHQPTDQPDEQPTDDQPIDQPTNVDPGKQSEKSQRLAPGALRGMVEDYLRNNSGEFSPSAIGKALDRSSGAIHNALEKLVMDSYAVRTSDKPKKYSLAAMTATSTE